MTTKMDGRLTVNKFIIYLILIAFTTGCTSMRSLPATDAQSLASQIEVGDKIKIIRNDEPDVTFKVSAYSFIGNSAIPKQLHGDSNGEHTIAGSNTTRMLKY